MSGLFSTLNIGSQSLYADRQGIDTTAHNIANAQTEGYSRQRVKLNQRDPSSRHGILIGNGVYVGSVDRFHDNFISKQVNNAVMASGNSSTRLSALHDLESIYSPELSSTVADELNSFFSSLQDLAKYPEEISARTAVREQGKNLSGAFRRVDLDLRRYRSGLNDHVEVTTKEVSHLLKSIAHHNSQIRELEVGPRNEANDLRDQRDKMIKDLSALIDINYYDDKDGMVTIHGPGELLLVDRNKFASLEVRQSHENDGLYDVVIQDFEKSNSRVVTNLLEGGKLQALVDVRDSVAKTLLDQNNEMAKATIEEINRVHSKGFGLEEFSNSSGRNFFESIKEDQYAAQNMKLDAFIENSTNAISAASMKGSPGDNVVANSLGRIKNKKIFNEGNASLNEYYANYVSILGMESNRTQHVKEADDIILADLQSRREAVAGVSLDEEAADMIRWQTAFTASSKVITTVDEMLETVLGLKR